MVQQERAFRTRHVVLEAAAQVFAEHGYATARIADILKIAGVTKGALYFHFDSKETLAKGVLELQTDRACRCPRTRRSQPRERARPRR